MTFRDIVNHRRAVRQFDSNQPLDPSVVEECLREAQLAPTSSNLQLWEAYHITNPEPKARVAADCMGQETATTADQFVVFVVRGDWAKDHAKALLEYELGNVERSSPQDRWEARKERYRQYYGKLIPMLYARGCGLLGVVRKAISCTLGISRPVVRTVTEADIKSKNHKSCALVAQTFMLAMASRQYDTCPIEGCDEVRLRRTLGLPCTAQISLVVSCGIRTDRGVWGDRFRFPFDKVYHRL